MIKERPILFSGAMVRAILELIKKHTRRCRGLERVNEDPDAWELADPVSCGTKSNPFVARHEKRGEESIAVFRPVAGGKPVSLHCPYGKPGDQLWVRETFRIYKVGSSECSAYRADADQDDLEYFRWKPSIHMPRWASRLSVEIVDIRVERLQDISPEDCRAEGMPVENNDVGVRYSFGVLWKQINGADSWEKNPWVWVVEFKKIEVCNG